MRASDLEGLKFFRKIRPLLESLHDVGTRRDKAANRDLHMDQYGVLVLMWMFNPILTSLRGLQQASTLKDVQKKFGVGRASLGSLSESVSIFDPEPLKQIDATPAKPKGKDDEKAVLASVLKPDRCYVTDRGYAKFELFNQINAIGSSYICRARDNNAPKILADRDLGEADRQAGVCIDRDVILGGHTSNKNTVATDHRRHRSPGAVHRDRSTAACSHGEQMICFYLLGWASLEELDGHIEKLKPKSA